MSMFYPTGRHNTSYQRVVVVRMGCELSKVAKDEQKFVRDVVALLRLPPF